MIARLTAASLAAVVLAAPAASAATYDFEDATIKTTPSGSINLYDAGSPMRLTKQHDANPAIAVLPTLSTVVAKSPTHSLRATIAAGSGYGRSEAVLPDRPLAAQSMAWDMLIPWAFEGYPAGSNEWLMPHQVWQTACGSPVIAMQFDRGGTDARTAKVHVNGRNDQTTSNPAATPVRLGGATLPKGRWIRLVEEWNPGPAGAFYRLKVDGQTVINSTGVPLGYRTSQCDKYPTPNVVRPKVGIYHGGGVTAKKVDLYYDNVTTGAVGIK